MMPRVKIGFVGLGAMGSRMAARAAMAFADVRGFNRSRVRVHGVAIAKTARQAAEGADFVVTMVSDARALRAVALGRDGLLAGLARGATWIDMSTSGRPIALAMCAAAMKRGAHFVDAPMSGTLGPAERGELVAFVGGDEKRARPLLRVLCKHWIRAGAVGQGQALKVIVNGLGAHHLVAFATMLAVGERAGLSRRVIVDAFTQGAFASPSYVGKKRKVLARKYDPEFTLALTLKDAKLAESLAREVGLDVPVLRRVAREVARGVDVGLGPRDLFALETLYPRKG